MNKVVKIMKNKLMIAAMVAVMVFGTAMVPVHATTITTNEQSVGAGLYYYVRKSVGGTELGVMHLQKVSSKKVSNTFTATIKCSSVTVYVKGKTSEGYAKKTVNKLPADASVIVTKSLPTTSKDKYTTAYGKCSVSF